MNAKRLVGAAILTLGILALVYGSFTYTQETHDASLGPIEIEMKDKETVNIPVWVGVVATVAGGAVLLFGGPSRAHS